MIKISKHLFFKEVTKSDIAIKKGINNMPDYRQLNNIRNWAESIFEPVRAYVGDPVGCTSIFRSPKLNKIIGGSKNSQHRAKNGAAGDIDADVYGYGKNSLIFNFIKNNLDFDQLIWEFGTYQEPAWVHVSYISKEKNRNEILKSVKIKGKTKYIKFN